MIEFLYDSDFSLKDSSKYADWISRVIKNEGCHIGDITYVFCDDEYLLSINQQYLKHDTYTDIITFDYTNQKTLNADIFISIERVDDNAKTFNVKFKDEILRVMAHGVLHLCGFKDKTEKEKILMRAKENESIKMFHVEQ